MEKLNADIKIIAIGTDRQNNRPVISHGCFLPATIALNLYHGNAEYIIVITYCKLEPVDSWSPYLIRSTILSSERTHWKCAVTFSSHNFAAIRWCHDNAIETPFCCYGRCSTEWNFKNQITTSFQLPNSLGALFELDRIDSGRLWRIISNLWGISNA